MTVAKPVWKRLLGPVYRLGLRGVALLVRLDPRRLARLAAWGGSVGREIARRRRERRLTVAVDVTALWEPLTGIGWYLYRLLEQLAGRDDLVLRLYGPSLASREAVAPPVVPLPTGPAIELVTYATPDPVGHPGHGLAIHPDRLIRLLRRAERWLIAADGNRVIFAPNYLPSSRLTAASGALVATVHDLGYKVVPWAIRPETLTRLERELDRVWFRAARVVTDSEAVRAEILERGLAGDERVRVIPLGPGQTAAADPASRGGRTGSLPGGLPERYALAVGTLEPRKNLGTLLTAWRALRQVRPDAPPLVLCGRLGWSAEELRRRIDAAREEGWVYVVGYAGEAELAALYRGALVFVFPSRYEGFGLPVLEAFTAGTPVVASDLPVLRELAGDAALYAPPERPDLWMERVAELLADPELRAQLGRRGKERAERFRWDEAAERHVAVFREAAES